MNARKELGTRVLVCLPHFPGSTSSLSKAGTYFPGGIGLEKRCRLMPWYGAFAELLPCLVVHSRVYTAQNSCLFLHGRWVLDSWSKSIMTWTLSSVPRSCCPLTLATLGAALMVQLPLKWPLQRGLGLGLWSEGPEWPLLPASGWSAVHPCCLFLGFCF